MGMEICLITDEISADPETAIELGVEWGIRNFELRGYFSDRVPRLSAYQRDKLPEILARYQARVVALSPGLFKFFLPARRLETFPVAAIEADIHRSVKTTYDLLQVHLNEILPETISMAKAYGAGIIQSFSFQRGGLPAEAIPDIVLDSIRQAAELVGQAGLILAVEVESGFWADTGSHTAAMLASIRHPALRVNWDPANAFEAGDIPYPAGYACIRDQVAHVHFKDVKRLPDGRTQYVTCGEVDWAGQIASLAADGYQGLISVETHMQPKVQSARLALDRLLELLRKTDATGSI
jgi:sugar phosphate isomerase/epimerase